MKIIELTFAIYSCTMTFIGQVNPFSNFGYAVPELGSDSNMKVNVPALFNKVPASALKSTYDMKYFH